MFCWCFEIKYDRAPDVVNLWNVAQVAILKSKLSNQPEGLPWQKRKLFQIDRLGISTKRGIWLKIRYLCLWSDRIGWQYLCFGSGWIGFTRNLLIGLHSTKILVLRVGSVRIHAIAFRLYWIEQQYLFFGSDWNRVMAFRKPSDSKALIWSDALY